MKQKSLCRFPGCMERAVRGAYSIPTTPVPGEPAFYSFMLLCKTHGDRAVKLGARKMGWRPKSGEKARS